MASESTIKATFDTPSIKTFHCLTKLYESAISFSTTSKECNSQFRLSLNKKVSLCFLKLSLTCLRLDKVPLSKEWFNSFSHNFPCLEELGLWNCKGFDELQLSSRSIENLNIEMHESTTKATIDAPSIKEFYYEAHISQSISFSATTSSEWNSDIYLSLDQLDASQWFLKVSEFVAELSQSQISLVLTHKGHEKNQRNIKQHLSDISVCCGNSYTPVAMKSLDLNFSGLHYDSFFSDFMNGLFRIIRPSEMKQYWYVNGWNLYDKDYQRKKNEAIEFLCRTLQMGRWEEEDEGMTSYFWQQDLEEVSLQVPFGSGSEEWCRVEETINWSEYVAALWRPPRTDFYELRFLLKRREISGKISVLVH